MEAIESGDPFQVRACGHNKALQRQTSAGFEKLIFNRRFSDIHAEHSTQDLSRAPTSAGKHTFCVLFRPYFEQYS